MIASLRGPVVDVALDHLVIECGGVGYKVLVTPATAGSARRGDELTILTMMIVREDSMTLYGFGSGEARDLFVLLQTVTGVGPRLALAALAVLEPAELTAALAGEDVKALMRIPGVGKRVADRLVVELRDKVGAIAPAATAAAVPTRVLGPGAQVVEALVGLGFPEASAEKAVAAQLAVDASLTSSALLRASLASLGRTR